MTRHLFFAITLIGTGMLLSSAAEAQEWQCEDRAANCLGRCADKAGGAGDWGGPSEQMFALRPAVDQMCAQRDQPALTRYAGAS